MTFTTIKNLFYHINSWEMSEDTLGVLLNLTVLFSVIFFYIFYTCCFSKRKSSGKGVGDEDFIYNYDCPICFNFLSIPIKSVCGHAFCLDCLYAYTKTNSKWKNLCPYCRTIIDKLNIVKNNDFVLLSNSEQAQMETKLKKIKALQNNCVPSQIKTALKKINRWILLLVLILMWFYIVKRIPKVYFYIYETNE